MRLAVALAWYSEPVELLTRLVESVAPVADELVALDGRWAGFADGAAGESTAEEHDAIANACIENGLDGRVISHGVWKSQVEKRARLMELAGENADWIFVLDGDEHVHEFDRPRVRSALELTSRDVATVTGLRLNVPWPKRGLPQHPQAMRRFYRSTSEQGELLTVEQAHHGYRLGREWLNGDPAYVTLAPALDLTEAVVIHHDCGGRAETRQEEMLAYYRQRTAERVEAWRR